MPCPHSSPGSGSRSDDSLSRRDLIRAAIAIGGSSGLSACLSRETGATTDTPTETPFPRGPEDPETLPDRQHAWTDYLVRSRFGNTVLPQHQLILLLEYTGSVPPGETTRARVESAFRTLERAFQRGTGGDESALQHEGLLFVVGYAPTYFDRFDESLPASIDLPTPADVLGALDEDASTVTPNTADVAIHMGSGFGSILLAAEQALFGEVDTVNGVAVEGGLDGVFERVERRSGFVGRGQPAQKYEDSSIPESSPLSMGFKSAFSDTLPSEDRVTIREGPFAGGTTMQVSRLSHDLETWYDRDDDDRVHRMFSPDHEPSEVGTVGEHLGAHSGLTREIGDKTETDASTDGVVGHSQKLARARDEDFNPIILRRDFNPTAEPGLHFDSWQRRIEDFVETRQAMNGAELEDVDEEDNGILSFITVESRATFLMPPRSLRAVPPPRPAPQA